MSTKRLSLLLTLLMITGGLYAQNGSIGIGTETPNPNAVLDLVSPQNNQGLLVPRLTTAQRTDAGFLSSLASTENSLLVYDTDENQFYYWLNDTWVSFSSGGFSPQLDFDDQTFILSIEQGNAVDLSALMGGNDSDSTNELQSLSFSNDTLFLSNGGGAIGIDTSSINEIQDLELNGDILTITNNSSATPIDLSAYSGGGGGTDSQTLSFDADTDSLFISNGNGIGLGDWINENDSDSTNELQTLNFDEGTNELSISDGNSIDLTNWISENDADSTNEIQDLQLIDDTLSITGNTSATEIDLTPYLDNTDNQTLNWNSSNLRLSIENGDTVNLSGITKWSSLGTKIFNNEDNVQINGKFITPPASAIVTLASGVTELTDISNRVILLRHEDRSGFIDRIVAGEDGQELILVGAPQDASAFDIEINSTDISVPDTETNRIRLSELSYALNEGRILKLMYLEDLGYWIEMSFSDTDWAD